MGSRAATSCSVAVRNALPRSEGGPARVRPRVNPPGNVALAGATCYEGTVIPPEEFRRLLGHFATGVTIVTTCDADDRPSGLTVSAFCSLSLDPPLVLICVDHKAQTYPALRGSGRFAVNILRVEDEALSRRFALTSGDKFEGLAFRRSALGVPVLEQSLAHLECVTVGEHVAGDHTIFIGRVEGGRVRGGRPLLYYRGRYGRLEGDAS